MDAIQMGEHCTQVHAIVAPCVTPEEFPGLIEDIEREFENDVVDDETRSNGPA